MYHEKYWGRGRGNCGLCRVFSEIALLRSISTALPWQCFLVEVLLWQVFDVYGSSRRSNLTNTCVSASDILQVSIVVSRRQRRKVRKMKITSRTKFVEGLGSLRIYFLIFVKSDKIDPLWKLESFSLVIWHFNDFCHHTSYNQIKIMHWHCH